MKILKVLKSKIRERFRFSRAHLIYRILRGKGVIWKANIHVKGTLVIPPQNLLVLNSSFHFEEQTREEYTSVFTVGKN